MKSSAMIHYGNQIVYLKDLLRELCVRDIKLRYSRSYLGIIWSLVYALAQMRILRFVFGAVLPLGIPNYAAFLYIGILAWGWLSASLNQATGSIIKSREIVRQSGFPLAVIPVTSLLTNLLDFVLAFPILLYFLYSGGASLTKTVVFFPLVIVVQFLFMLGLAYLLAALQVLFHDTRHIVRVALQLGFFVSPIFYDASVVPEKYMLFYRLNPFAPIIDAYRDVLIDGVPPNFNALLVISGLSLLLIYFGYTFFAKTRDRFVEEL
ncbi:MAG: ABC transporter permease [Chloroflexota bacterium]